MSKNSALQTCNHGHMLLELPARWPSKPRTLTSVWFVCVHRQQIGCPSTFCFVSSPLPLLSGHPFLLCWQPAPIRVTFNWDEDELWPSCLSVYFLCLSGSESWCRNRILWVWQLGARKDFLETNSYHLNLKIYLDYNAIDIDLTDIKITLRDWSADWQLQSWTQNTKKFMKASLTREPI